MRVLTTLFAVSVVVAIAAGSPLVAPPAASFAEKPAAVAPADAPPAVTSSDAAPTDAVVADEEERARELLGNLAKTYRHLEDVTVRFATTPKGEEAVAYYTDGEIVVNTNHTVGVDEILAHEVWHIIDWRDNGRLDWGEDLPPSNSSDYLSR